MYIQLIFQNIHTEKSTRPKFPCSICTRTCLSKPGLQMHNELRHQNFPPRNYPCTLCDGAFSVLSNLRRHIKVVHPESNAAIKSCDQCEYKTYSKSDFSRHLKIHEGKNKRDCYVCGEKFSFLSGHRVECIRLRCRKLLNSY